MQPLSISISLPTKLEYLKENLISYSKRIDEYNTCIQFLNDREIEVIIDFQASFYHGSVGHVKHITVTEQDLYTVISCSISLILSLYDFKRIFVSLKISENNDGTYRIDVYSPPHIY